MMILIIISSIVIIATGVGLMAILLELMQKRSNAHIPYGPYEKFMKRGLDAFLSTGALIILSPILLIIAILVRVKLGSPVLFTQDRPGKDEKIFKLYKFRTMTDDKDEKGNLKPDSERLTAFGRKLRATSLDELPELFNIIKGDMSIIGPRPLIPAYLPYYTEEEHHRHDVRPGLSGLAQANGRSFISWESIFGYDLEYVNQISFINDCKIIFNTVKNIVTKHDVADFTQSYIGSDGKKHILIEGKDYIIHQPLDEEREHHLDRKRIGKDENEDNKAYS